MSFTLVMNWSDGNVWEMLIKKLCPLIGARRQGVTWELGLVKTRMHRYTCIRANVHTDIHKLTRPDSS